MLLFYLFPLLFEILLKYSGFLDFVIIRYMIAASFVGFYNTPLMRRLLPVPHNTSITKVMYNNPV